MGERVAGGNRSSAYGSPTAVQGEVSCVHLGSGPAHLGSGIERPQAWYNDTAALERQAASKDPEPATCLWPAGDDLVSWPFAFESIQIALAAKEIDGGNAFSMA
jgi:hypothetical protein